MAGLQEGVEHLLAIISSFSKLHVPPLCSVIARRLEDYLLLVQFSLCVYAYMMMFARLFKVRVIAKVFGLLSWDQLS